MDISVLSINKLKSVLSDNSKPDESLLQAMSGDNRAGVRKLYEQWLLKRQKNEAEKSRIEKLYEQESKYRSKGFGLIAGVDEAGRGPLAGPVVAAAVILPENACLPGLNDSKKLPVSARERLFVAIKPIALSWAVGMASVEEICELNILQASLLAMCRSVDSLKVKPDFVLVDGPNGLNLPLPQYSLVKGDTLSASIASASILAKVTRDKIMLEYHDEFPEYGFDRHKGYPTVEHLRALTRYGPCRIHRRDFKPVKDFDQLLSNSLSVE
ncbi:Ribonuclease H [Desulfofarcimen acetoxidans DSM 771]|uniref:Ribonuclease HII n=1 Tax=Desulfofarcimen acetoxidans (strain ATCC 49208 / DSM 771 / KCTC 5769 / VKM B-1644 / 5575) TaxID=485916 RepID=C8W5A6_DESAS|nr:ribonuclease HII [Desulfofarcimen acetoxidans]ACV62088.1 Ribonuclease H [Desulfofarcimen acetoxidans DSM 771]